MTRSSDMTRAQQRLRRLLALVDDPELKAELVREMERIAVLDQRDRETALSKQRVQTGITADQRTVSGRLYPLAVLQQAVDRYQEQIDNGTAFGTFFGQPDGRLRFSDVSHRVTNMHVDEDGNVRAEIEVLNTDRGRVLQAMLESRIPMALSARGHASVNADGQVGEDYQLLGFDVVDVDRDAPGWDTIPFTANTQSIDEQRQREQERRERARRNQPRRLARDDDS